MACVNLHTSDLNLFIRIVETVRITEAANQLGITPAAVNSALKRLDKQLDVQLIIRTTGNYASPRRGAVPVSLPSGVRNLEQGRIAAHQMQGKISGKLRLSVASDLGRNTVLPWIDELLDLHPSLLIDLSVGDSLSDFFLDQVDVALRYGKPQDSSMVSFHIATMNRITCISTLHDPFW